MALAGYEVVVKGGASSNPATEMDGITSVSFGPNRDMLETTKFNNVNANRSRMAGLKDGTIQISGQYIGNDTAQTALRTAWSNGSDFYCQILWDGLTGHEVRCAVESYEISADVGGLVEFTATLQFNDIPSSV